MKHLFVLTIGRLATTDGVTPGHVSADHKDAA